MLILYISIYLLETGKYMYTYSLHKVGCIFITICCLVASWCNYACSNYRLNLKQLLVI